MRSLGRPNREQIVTTRDDQLSTLQALDLSNGDRFAEILNQGAVNLKQRYPQSSSLIENVYLLALSRKPSAKELTILESILGDRPTNESIADLVWSVVMLPEFQHVR